MSASPKLWLVAAASLVPGGAHFVVGRRALAGALGACIVAAALGAFGSELARPGLLCGLGLIWLTDLVGALRVRRRPADPPDWAAIAVAGLGLAAAASIALAVTLGTLRKPAPTLAPSVDSASTVATPDVTPAAPPAPDRPPPTSASVPLQGRVRAVASSDPVTPATLTFGDTAWFAEEIVQAIAILDDEVVASTRHGWTTFDRAGTPLERVRRDGVIGFVGIGKTWIAASEPSWAAGQVWRRATGEHLDFGPITAAGLSHDGEVLALGDASGDLRLVRDGEPVDSFFTNHDILHVSPGPDGSTALVGAQTVALVDPDGDRLVQPSACRLALNLPEVIVFRGCGDGQTMPSTWVYDRELVVLWSDPWWGLAMTVDPLDGALVFADAGVVRWLDPTTGAERGRVVLPSPQFIHAIAADAEGVYVSQGHRVVPIPRPGPDTPAVLDPVFDTAPPLVAITEAYAIVGLSQGPTAQLTRDGTFVRWLARSGTQAVAVLDTGHVLVKTHEGSVTWSLEGASLAQFPPHYMIGVAVPGTGSVLATLDDGYVRLLDVVGGGSRPLDGSLGLSPLGFAATADGQVLFTHIPRTREVRVWTADGVELPPIQLDFDVWLVAAGPRGPLVQGVDKRWRELWPDGAGGWRITERHRFPRPIVPDSTGRALAVGNDRFEVFDLAGESVLEVEFGDIDVIEQVFIPGFVVVRAADGRSFAWAVP